MKFESDLAISQGLDLLLGACARDAAFCFLGSWWAEGL